MKTTSSIFIVVTGCVLIAGCVTNSLAPGADQVRIVHNLADVVGCTAVGNVSAGEANLDVRNLTVGLGGNVLFVTREVPIQTIAAGVAYHCP